MRIVVQHVAADSDVRPPQLWQLGITFDVLGSLLGIGPVVSPIEVDTHAPFQPTHVEPGHHESILVGDPDLRLRARKVVADKQLAG